MRIGLLFGMKFSKKKTFTVENKEAQHGENNGK
jgi:hypothetical protein